MELKLCGSASILGKLLGGVFKRQQLSSSKKRHASGSSEAAAISNEYVCGPAQYWFPEAVEIIGGSVAEVV